MTKPFASVTWGRAGWFLALGLALLAGAWFRFKGFATWPLAVDEYYIYRSVAFVLDTGLPAFPCGGFYARGLLYQYTLAPLLAAGMSPEAALRLVTILSSLATLPAVFLLARALAPDRHAVAAACACVIILALSAWEIEMARFGRMYAPFHALFAWYLYHSSRLLGYGEFWRWRWLVGLSAIAPFVWEGGLITAALTFLVILLAKDLHQVGKFMIATAILGFGYWFPTANFRLAGDIPAFPAHLMDATASAEGPMGIAGIAQQLHPAGITLATATLVLAALLLWKTRPTSPWTYLAVASIALTASAVQPMLAFPMLLGAWLLGWTDTRTLGKTGWRAFLALVVVATAGWVILRLAMQPALPVGLDVIRALAPLYQFPNFKQALIEPWLYTIPTVVAMIALGAAAGILYVAKSSEDQSLGLRWLLLVALVGVSFVAVAPTPYRATRYAFFLYPVFVLLAVLGPTLLAASINAGRRVPAGLVPAVVLLAFAVSEDFRAQHLLNIDSYQANFRVGYSPRITSHFYARFDHRAPGEYLAEHAQAGDVIMITEAALAHYLPWLDAVYLADDDERFLSQSCRMGTVERWTNAALVYDDSSARSFLSAPRQGDAWLVVNKKMRIWNPWQQDLVDWISAAPEFTTLDQAYEVYRLPPPPMTDPGT